jgi:hypothetical protein
LTVKGITGPNPAGKLPNVSHLAAVDIEFPRRG